MLERAGEMFDISEFLRKQQESESARTKFLAEQVSKGCSSCSQWDSYWGCNKCESTLKEKRKQVGFYSDCDANLKR